MPLESVLICLDNSDWSRNGDYSPTRLDAQFDAVTRMGYAIGANGHPESTVGMLSMAGDSVQLLTSPTRDITKYLATLRKVFSKGVCDFSTSIRIAHLALKHRKNKNGKQRIIMFVGSPLKESADDLVKLGKQLKKNNVGLDIVSIGEIEGNEDKLREMINAVNSGDNSHLVAIPHGMNVTESIFASALFEGEGSFAPQMAGGAGMDDFGGIDPNMEPELALALRLSAEEARVAARQTSEDAPSAEDNTNMAVDGMDFDDELAQAIALSMMDANNASTSNMASSVSPDKQVAQESQPIASTSFEDDIDDDLALQQALALSIGSQPAVNDEQTSSSSSNVQSSSSSDEHLQNLGINPGLLNELLQSVNVDSSSDAFKEALKTLTQANNEGESTDSQSKKRKNGDRDDKKTDG